MFIILIFTLIPISLSDTRIGIYKSKILNDVKITFNGTFRLHYDNNRHNSSNWRDQSDGISLILSPGTFKSDDELWKSIINLFDNIPEQTIDYNNELNKSPKPLYIHKSNLINQCKSSNRDNIAMSGNLDNFNGIKYKDIIKNQISNVDVRNSIKFGYQKSCFHDYTIQPWISNNEFNNTLNTNNLNVNNFYRLILIPKLYEIRYNFNRRIRNLINQEISDKLIINELYWFNMQYDGSNVIVTFLCKFTTNKTDILDNFKFLSNDLDIINKININKAYIHQSISGIGSHKLLNVKISHLDSNKILKIVHFMDNSYFVDPSEIFSMTDESFKLKNCKRNIGKPFDNIRVTKNNIENSFNDSSVQIVEIIICPHSNTIEYSLPIHARYMPICRHGVNCTGYEYSLITIPNVYYSNDFNEDFVLFDNVELAKLLQHVYEVSFVKYIGMASNSYSKFSNSENYYWNRVAMVKTNTLVYSDLNINLPSRINPSVVEFNQDIGNLYTVSTLTCGKQSDYLLTVIITLLTPITFTCYTIGLLILNNTKFNSIMFNTLNLVKNVLGIKRLD